MDDHELQLQIPHFVFNAPLAVVGGGAELLPVVWHSAHQPPVLAPDHHRPRLPFDFALHDNDDEPPPRPPHPDLSALLAAPLALRGIYSASGFDCLSILARVANRPFPSIVLGPVDHTCAFVVVDVSKYDSPVVYCSPSFSTLTGYPPHEVIGRNCRFLQAPGGVVHKGEPRIHTSPDAVGYLRKSLVAGKECQTSILNYKKDGTAFNNLVTVIPLPNGLTGSPDEQDIIYHVGFQVDLGEQPYAIHDKLRDGSYVVNYAAQDQFARSNGNFNAPRKGNSIPPLLFSSDLRRLLDDPAFQRSVSGANAHVSSDDAGAQNSLLSLVLLEALPGFIHVVSLKGTFLYVAPSVQRVLGYSADELVGKSISDYAHPEDVVPLMRELKEGSATGPASPATADVPFGMPRSIDLLFRVRTKMGRYVWVECRGRLHVEPGKGRKAIILSGRAREMMSLKWDDVRRAGGLARGLRVAMPPAPQAQCEDPTSVCMFQDVEQEAWGMLGGMCRRTATFMSVGRGVRDVLGWTPDDLLGTSLMRLVCDEGAQNTIGGFVEDMRAYQALVRQGSPPLGDGMRVRKTRCKLRKKNEERPADVWFILYRADAEAEAGGEDTDHGAGSSITPAPLVYQIRLVSADVIVPGHSATTKARAKPASPYVSSLAGAVSLPRPTTPSSEATSTPPPPPPPSFDMFDELSMARASSWQYELQQLRITNMKLREELARLEDTEGAAAAASGTGQENNTVPLRQSQDRAGYEDQHLIRYEGEVVRSAAPELPSPPPPQQQQTQQYRTYGEIPPQPLFTMQPQRPREHTHQTDHAYVPPHPVGYEYGYDYHVPDCDLHPLQTEDQPRSYQPYLHHPTPAPVPTQRQFTHPGLPRRDPAPDVHSRAGPKGTPLDWNTMPSGPPLHSPVMAMPVPGYAPPLPVSYGSLKRTWSAAGN